MKCAGRETEAAARQTTHTHATEMGIRCIQQSASASQKYRIPAARARVLTTHQTILSSEILCQSSCI